MKKSANYPCCVTLCICKFCTVLNQLTKFLKNILKLLDKINSAEIESFYIKVNVSQMGMEMPMEMKSKKPDKFIINIDIQGQKMIQAFDGEKGWMIIPMMSPDPQELAGEQLQQVREQVNMEGELYNYKKKAVLPI